MTHSRQGLLADMWSHALLADADRNRIRRGQDYVERRALLEASVEPGVVWALVQGSSAKPYESEIHAPLVDPTALERATVPLLAELLTAHPDPNMIGELVETVPELVPDSDELHFTCSCPDWASPCKHVIALGLVLGDSLDDQVGLFLRFRGLDTSTVLRVMTELEHRRSSPMHRPELRPGLRPGDRPGPRPEERAGLRPEDRPGLRLGHEPARRPEHEPRPGPGEPRGHGIDLHEFWHGAPLPNDADFHILNGADRAPEALLAPPLPWPKSGDHEASP